MRGKTYSLVDLEAMRVYARCRKYNETDWLKRFEASKEVEKLDAAIKRALRNGSLRAKL